MRSWAKTSPVSVGVLLVIAGFIAMFLAWNGAADKDFVQGQVPYLISGGLVGLALVGSGLTVINVQARRADQTELLNRLEAMLEARDTQITEVITAPPTRARRARKAS
ncbi:MAG TPA: hypothetical protein VMZ22_11545 [Acidimicrobiales bacterium]|nr:hypothetical protein [Acidimicrobiales bacterium]